MGLVDHAPPLGAVLAELEALLGYAELDLMHVQHHPGVSRLFQHPAPLAAPQAASLGDLTTAARPSDSAVHLTPGPPTLRPGRARGSPLGGPRGTCSLRM